MATPVGVTPDSGRIVGIFPKREQWAGEANEGNIIGVREETEEKAERTDWEGIVGEIPN